MPARLLRLGFGVLTLAAVAVNLATAFDEVPGFALLVAWAGNATRGRGVPSPA